MPAMFSRTNNTSNRGRPARQPASQPARAENSTPAPAPQAANPGAVTQGSGTYRPNAMRAQLMQRTEENRSAHHASPRNVPAAGSWRVGLEAWVQAGPPGPAGDRVQRSLVRDQLLRQDRAHYDNPRHSGSVTLGRSGGLSSLPPVLPGWITELEVAGNPLPSLPSHLPPGLTTLQAGRTLLQALPDSLPAGLHTLRVAFARLTQLPDHLPNQLRTLEVSGNRLTHLPHQLPETLESLVAVDNQLTTLPDHLPTNLRTLDVSRNHIVDLSESTLAALDRMHPDAVIDLRDNPLSEPTLLRLNAIRQHNAHGPAIQLGTDQYRLIVRPNGAEAAPAERANAARPEVARQRPTPRDRPAQAAGRPVVHQRPLPVTLNNASSAPPSTSRLWQSFTTEPGGAEFAQFLGRLMRTVNANDSAFQLSLAQWMTQLESDPQLRRDTFAISIGATESCEDRISLTYNAMRKLSMAADVSRGLYDQRLPDLITLARGVFRLEQLEQIARETTTALVRTHGAAQVDEIEVYLGYQVMLREPLALPVDTANMAFFRCSRLTQDDLDRAQARVLAAEPQEFANYLATDFAPWQEVIQRLAPDLHEQAQERLIEAMGDEFTNRLNTQLQAMDLQGDTDAERTLGPQVQAEITREIRSQLTRDFLARQGLLDLLNR